MQRQAADDLKRLVTDALVERRPRSTRARRLRDAAPARAACRRPARGAAAIGVEERKGPRVGAPDGAIQGFLKSAGLARIEDAKIETDPKKGEFYVAVIDRPGRATTEVLAEILPAIVRGFPWPKSMRWGAGLGRAPTRCAGCGRCTRSSAPSAAAHETPEIVAFAVDGLAAGDVTYGHRFMAPRRDQGPALRGLCRQRSPRRRSCSTPTGARRSSSPTRAISRSRMGSSSSRTRACSRRSPASSNGRSC